MRFKGTPRDLAYTGAKWLTIFFGATVVLFFVEYLWFLFSERDQLESLGVSGPRLLVVVAYSWIFFLPHAIVLVALASSIGGWMIAFFGLFVASGGQRLALFIFGFATLIAAMGLSGPYWYAAIPSTIALGYLTLWAWSLRNHIQVVQLGAKQVEGVVQQQQALRDRELTQEDVISRR